MTAFLWQVLAAMAFPVLVVWGVVFAALLRPLPWAMLASAGASAFTLFVYHLDSHGALAMRRRRIPFSFWEELPAWAAAGALWALLFFLAFRAIAWAFARLPPGPAPPS